MRTLVEYGLANAAAATLLAVAALLVGLVVRRPAVRNALWVLVLVRLVLPPVWTVTVTVPAHDVAPDVSAAAPSNPERTPAPDLVVPDDGPAHVNGARAAAPPPAAPTADPAEVPPPPPINPPPTAAAFAVAALVWAVGTVFVLVRSGGRIVRFRRVLSDARPAPAAIQRQADELARVMGLRHCPAVCLVPGRVSPALWMPGLCARRAALILPAGLVPLLDDPQRAAVIAHELAHLRRGDPWVRWLELLVGALYWWHPLLGWFRRELRAAEEECCDLRVVAAVGGRRDYATALVETAAFLGGSGPMPALASGAGPVRHLQRRVTMIMRATWPAGLTRVGLAAVLGLGGLGLAFGPAVAQDRDEKREVERKERGRGEDRKDPPREERGRDRVRDRDDGPPRERGDREAIEKARVAVERARKVAREAAEQLRAAEEALARAEGRPGPRREARDPGDRRPDVPPPPPGVPGMRPLPPAPPAPPGFPRRADGAGEFRDLQMQIEELRRSLEQMRQELRRERGDRKEPEPRRERPKDEPKRPVREAERPST